MCIDNSMSCSCCGVWYGEVQGMWWGSISVGVVKVDKGWLLGVCFALCFLLLE
jgi:hypothetical protein